MADFPYIKFYTDAYLADTTHLRTEEHGAYLLLLFSAWRSADCSVPNDDDALARIVGLSPARWQSVKPAVMAFWTLNKRRKRWTQKRLQNERGSVSEKSSKARGSAATRWNKTKSGDANAMRTQCYPEPEPERKPKGFQGARAREKPKGWVERRTHSQALTDIISRIDQHEQRGIEDDSGSSQAPVQLLPIVRAG